MITNKEKLSILRDKIYEDIYNFPDKSFEQAMDFISTGWPCDFFNYHTWSYAKHIIEDIIEELENIKKPVLKT